MSWQEIIKGFKAEKGKGDGVSATLVLLYLSLGQDFAYNMAKAFNDNLVEVNGWNQETLEYAKKLKDVNQLSVLLKDMEEKGLLISEKEVRGRRRRLYKLKPNIIFMPETTEAGREASRLGLEAIGRGYRVINDLEEINRLLLMLEGLDRTECFKKWSHMGSYDFIAFLNFLGQEAEGFKLDEASRLIKDHLAVLKYIEDPGKFARTLNSY